MRRNLIPLFLDGGFMKLQREVIQEEESTRFQREDILYLSGRRMVNEHLLTQELFGVSFYALHITKLNRR